MKTIEPTAYIEFHFIDGTSKIWYLEKKNAEDMKKRILEEQQIEPDMLFLEPNLALYVNKANVKYFEIKENE